MIISLSYHYHLIGAMHIDAGYYGCAPLGAPLADIQYEEMKVISKYPEI